jgi:hypothetical protein
LSSRGDARRYIIQNRQEKAGKAGTSNQTAVYSKDVGNEPKRQKWVSVSMGDGDGDDIKRGGIIANLSKTRQRATRSRE